MANKIKYGLQNVYYSKITVSTSGVETYATPVALPGAVSLSLDAEGDMNKFYADNMIYWQQASNNGYSGSLELAMLPDSFRKDILEEVEDNNGLLVEKNIVATTAFALLFEFAGDESSKRGVLYNCAVTRPSVSGSTTQESIDPQTETLEISCTANKNGYVKSSIGYDASPASKYQTWFEAVVEPSSHNNQLYRG